MKRGIFYTLLLLTMMSACKSKDDDPDPIPVVPVASDLIISEMSTAINTDPLAAGARSHYVELYNGTGKTVELSNYAIGYYAVTDTSTLSNWNFSAVGSFITLNKSLATGKCYVIASPQADAATIKRDTTWGTSSTLAANSSMPLQLSGNSAIALLKKDAAGTFTLNGNSYKIVDAFGSPLVARVTAQGAVSARNNIIWTVADQNKDTRNRTFWRKAASKDPNADWSKTKGTNADNSEWRVSEDRKWDYTNIGLPSTK
ncbi:MAG: lamin tail domain-containing protein [Saprospiraceae bacterium]